GLLLKDAEVVTAARLLLRECAQQLRPFNSAFGVDGAGCRIEPGHTIQRAHVQQDTARSKLLAAHGVAASRDADRQTLAPSRKNRRTQLINRRRANDARHTRRVHLRVDIVDFVGALPAAQREGGGGKRDAGTKEISATKTHRASLLSVRDWRKGSTIRTLC